MFLIQTYTNTKCELEVAKTRLNLLMDRKEKLYCDYFPVTSKPKEIVVNGGEHEHDKMALYLHDLHNVDVGTGMSLAEEIEVQQERVNKLETYIKEMDTTLSKLTGIEYALYYEIVVKGISVTKAVTNVAESYNKDLGTVWKHHYRKIKKEIKKVTKYTQ